MKKIQALHNDNANKIVEQATQEKNAMVHLNFLIDLAMVTTDAKPVPEEPKIPKPGTIPMQILEQNGEKRSERNSPI